MQYTIMKNLTISGKSVFWTLQDGTNVVCRVVRKKGGEDLVKLVENGVTEFEFEPGNRINHASYLLYQQKRVVRMNRKAFGLLQRFLAEKTNLIKSKFKNDLQSTDSIHSISRISQSSEISLQSRIPVSVGSENHIQSTHPSIENNLLYGGQEIETRSSDCEEEGGKLLFRVSENFYNELDKLEAFDRHLKSREEEGRQIIARGERLQAEGRGLQQSDSESERREGEFRIRLGAEDIGTGQLTIGFADLRRGQCEIAIGQREIAIGQSEIAIDLIRLNSLIRARGLDPEGILDKHDADLERIAYNNSLDSLDSLSTPKLIVQVN
jgi:hypothetical protein